MTALDMARTAYSAPGTPARSLRSVEYDLFARVTHRLRAALAAQRADFAGLVAALHDNNRLWVTLAGDVAEPGNALPAALRAQLFYLYQFTEQHSRKVMAGTAAADVLIDINMAVMRGLRGEGVT